MVHTGGGIYHSGCRIREAEGLKDELELAIDQWEVDHAEQCDNPDGHYDD